MSSLIHNCILATVLLHSVGCSQDPISPIVHSYSLDYESLERQGRPRFSPRPAAPIPQSRTRFTKRANSNSFISNTTASFVIYLTCASVTELQCKQTLRHLSRAANRIERVVHLPEQVYINASFYPFCQSKIDCDDSSVLGQAAPSNWYLFADDGTQTNMSLPAGVDPNYAYPSALVRQWLPKDPALSQSFPDIGSSFNSEVNWWFSSAFGSDDKGLPQQGQFGPITSNLNSTLKSYDFEQVAMHELLHGMGLISSWYHWIDDELFLPSFPVYSGSNFTGLSLSYIYDRHLSDAVNGFWMKDYAAVVKRDLNKAIDRAKQTGRNYQWRDFFMETEGGNISRALKAKGSPWLTPRGVWSWFPVIEGPNVLMRYAILFTPTKFDEGSTGSHLDDKFYVGTSQFLMRPFAAKHVGLDGYIPSNPRGPIAETTLGILRAMGYTTRQ